MNPSTLDALHEIFGADALSTEAAECAAYGYDNSRREARPEAVVFPTAHDQVGALTKLCHDQRVPLVARGRGTNTTGASVPLAGGIVASFERMNRILAIDPGNRLAVVQPGVLNADLQTALKPHGFFWAPDPTSAPFCSIGGNLACNAGGPRAVKYGATRDNVLALRAVDGRGAEFRCGKPTTKGATGYDLTRLLIGSEGTLAIITEATLKLTPLAGATRTLAATFVDVACATAAVTRIMAQPVIPCALEFMDGEALRLAAGDAWLGSVHDGADALDVRTAWPPGDDLHLELTVASPRVGTVPLRELVTVTAAYAKETEGTKLVIEARAKMDAAKTDDERDAARKEVVAALDALNESQGEVPLIRPDVDEAMVAQVVAAWTGIPIGKMVQDDVKNLLEMEAQLTRRIKGQDYGIHTIAKELRSARAGLKPLNTPQGVFILVGPSGVGKTETALGIADLMFGGGGDDVDVEQAGGAAGDGARVAAAHPFPDAGVPITEFLAQGRDEPRPPRLFGLCRLPAIDAAAQAHAHERRGVRRLRRSRRRDADSGGLVQGSLIRFT